MRTYVLVKIGQANAKLLSTIEKYWKSDTIISRIAPESIVLLNIPVVHSGTITGHCSSFWVIQVHFSV